MKKGDDCRYFYVQKRDKDTLIPIILREVEENSVIHSDEWPSYSNLINLNYNHQTVNHQVNYVDPATGAHTQEIERFQKSNTKKIESVPANTFQSHLDYFCWRKMRKSSNDLFLAFLSDIVSINQ